MREHHKSKTATCTQSSMREVEFGDIGHSTHEEEIVKMDRERDERVGHQKKEVRKAVIR